MITGGPSGISIADVGGAGGVGSVCWVGGVSEAGARQPTAIKLMANNNANGINNAFFFTCSFSLELLNLKSITIQPIGQS